MWPVRIIYFVVDFFRLRALKRIELKHLRMFPSVWWKLMCLHTDKQQRDWDENIKNDAAYLSILILIRSFGSTTALIMEKNDDPLPKHNQNLQDIKVIKNIKRKEWLILKDQNIQNHNIPIKEVLQKYHYLIFIRLHLWTTNISETRGP